MANKARLKRKGKFSFSYVAKDAKKKTIKGQLFAENKTSAQVALKRQGFTDIHVTLTKEPSFIVKFLTKKSATYSDVTVFTRQLATMQTSGIPLVQGLILIAEGTKKPVVKTLINNIKTDIEAGGTLSESLRRHPQEFDELYCNLVDSGEVSGSLDIMLQRLATYREKTESLQRKLKKAMFYPLAVMIIASIVTAILLVKVVPTFQSMFEGFGAQLPGFTQFILNISETLQHYGLRVIAGIGIFIWLFTRLYKTNKKFSSIVQKTTLKLPVAGMIINKASIARFARTLATTFAAGVPLPEALLLVAKTSGNVVYKTAILKIREGVSVGKRINTSMLEAKIFPPMVVQMVAMGEETGQLEEMLLKVATIYEDQVDAAVDGLSSLLEPLIMVILGIVVGGLVISMYLPIFKMGSVF